MGNPRRRDRARRFADRYREDENARRETWRLLNEFARTMPRYEARTYLDVVRRWLTPVR